MTNNDKIEKIDFMKDFIESFEFQGKNQGFRKKIRIKIIKIYGAKHSPYTLSLEWPLADFRHSMQIWSFSILDLILK